MREKGQTEVAKTLGTPVFSRGIEILTEKFQFLLAAFARDVEKKGEACIPLLFIEEPESHMHPQMQHSFAEHLEKFLANISTIHIQTFLTTHSAHIANTMDFSKIRYAQKSKSGVVYKNLDIFAKENADNMEFIKKYLTLSRCDLFFADKIIFVEGASERLLLPDMIEKCEKEKLFDSEKYIANLERQLNFYTLKQSSLQNMVLRVKNMTM